MRDLKLNKINFVKHDEKCRICFNYFKGKEKKHKITKKIQEDFQAVTGTELILKPKLSKIICTQCNKELSEVSSVATKFADIQKKYYNHLKLDVTSSKIENEGKSNNQIVDATDFFTLDFSLNDVKTENAPTPLLFDSTTFLDLYMKKTNTAQVPQECFKSENGDFTPQQDIYKSDNQDKFKGKKSIPCHLCGKILTNKRCLENHIIRIHKRVKKFFCDFCPYGSTEKYSLQLHIKNIHLKSKKTYKCDYVDCDFIANSSSSLQYHKAKKHIGSIHECHCGKKFFTKTFLKLHIDQVHNRLKNYHCTECDKSFFKKNILKEHFKIHHLMTLDIACEVCGKLFATDRQLKVHKVHHNEKSFVCTYPGCDKSFHRSSFLVTHIKVHQNLREFQCHLCESSYFTNNHLNTHLNVAHGRKTYFCELCNFTNNRQDYLKNHLKSAHKLDEKEMKTILARVKVVTIDI